MLEIHGKRECPFAWRVRLAAREKDVPFEWVPFDGPSPDPRAAHRNPDQRSPLLWDAGFSLTESMVIAEYLEESQGGRALMPSGPQERARARLLLATVVRSLETVPSYAPDEAAARKQIREGLAELEGTLSDGRIWLGGEMPMLPDLMLWPFLSLQEQDGSPIPPELPRAQRYWQRVKEQRSLTSTRP
ncbi:MAG TPA: glutathione S-transferase family protein [Myxococcales bacterium]|nr:glutathione S-transferase family protein [Myxococcales bacterium]